MSLVTSCFAIENYIKKCVFNRRILIEQSIGRN